MVAGKRNIAKRAAGLQTNRVEVRLTLAVGIQGSVMPVDQKSCARRVARKHGPDSLGIEFDGHEAQPVAAVADIVRFQLAQKSFPEAYRAVHLLGSEARQPGGVLGGDHSYVFQTGGAGARKRPPLNLYRIHQIEHPNLQGVEEPVHRFQAQPATRIEKIGEMALLETGLARQRAAGQFPSPDPRPDMRAQSVLQVSESHGNDIPRSYTCTLVIFLEQ